jgi:hypothetical protein
MYMFSCEETIFKHSEAEIFQQLPLALLHFSDIGKPFTIVHCNLLPRSILILKAHFSVSSPVSFFIVPISHMRYILHNHLAVPHLVKVSGS